MSTTDELRQILKEDKSGKNLYNHLTETLMKLLIDKPTNAYDQFELFSADVKLNPFNPDPEAGRAVARSEEEIATQLAWTKKCAALLKINDEPQEDFSVKFPDLMEEAGLWDWAGISLGKAETYRLYLSVKQLAESLPAEVGSLRFFGQISTTGKKPYVIVEGLSFEEDEDVDVSLQEGKNGSNKHSYWVARSCTATPDDWVKLPDVTAAQVVTARQFKRFLTGDLDAIVNSYPSFPGTEKNLLRTQIARIAGATSISPEGHFDLDDEEDPPVVKEAEIDTINEKFPKLAAELKDPDAWRHHVMDLNVIGRTLALPDVLDENGDPIEAEDPIELTVPLDTIKPEAWTFRLCPGGAGTAPGSSVVARSLAWPGAVAVAAGKRFVNIYIGHGIVFEKTSYSPPMPAPIQAEWRAPTEDEEADGGMSLVEQDDVREDPIIPEPEEEQGDEDD